MAMVISPRGRIRVKRRVLRFSDGRKRQVMLVEPMRPLEIKIAPEGAWLAEEKKDGSLTMMYAVPGSVAYVNRRGINKTDVYPELIDDEPKHLKIHGPTIIEGEAYALKGDTDSFERFLTRDLVQSPERAREKERMQQAPLRYEAFDIVMKDGEWLASKPIEERKEILRRTIEPTRELKISKYSGDQKGFTERMRKDPTAEGVVFKKAGSEYESGRSPLWRKLKFKKSADVVITGYEKGEGKRENIGGLIAKVWDRKAGSLVEVAKVGTGFSDKELADIKRRLDRGERVFAKIEYVKVGTRGRLRVPSFKGLRTDIGVKDTHL